MKRRLLVLSALSAMIVVATLAAQRNRDSDLLLLQWAGKSQGETPPVAVLIEMGVEDQNPEDWSGQAAVKGAKVVHREGYRFRKEDKLTGQYGWTASSHRGIRVPKGDPRIGKMEGIATVGVVLHLTDVDDTPTLILNFEKPGFGEVMPLKDVLAGKTAKVAGGIVVRLVSTATPVATGKTEDDYPAACYAPDGTLWLAYNSYTIRDEDRRIEAPNLKKQPENFKAFYVPEFADQVLAKSYKDGKWSEPIAITGPNESIARIAIAAEGNGSVCVAYSAFRDGEHKVYGRSIQGGKVVPKKN